MQKTFPEIKTERLTLRKIQETDLHNIHAGLSNPKVIKYYGVSYNTMDETSEQMKWYENLEETGTGIWWAICSNKDMKFMGGGGLNDLNPNHRKAEIGFWLLPEFWGQRIMKEAIPVIVEYGFKELDLHRIEGFVESDNHNSRKALEKISFDYEGTMKDCEIKNGEYISLDIYARINPRELSI